MDKGGVSMDARQDEWGWVVLPDHRTFSIESSTAHGHGGMILGDQETKEPNLPPAEVADVRKPVDECKDIGVVPDETRSSQEELMPKGTAHGHGGMILGDQETKEPNLPPAEDADVRKPVDECKDIGVVPDETRSSQEELVPKVTEQLVSDGEDEHVTFQSSDAKEVDDDMVVVSEVAPHQFAEEEDRTRQECVVFSVGKLKVNGIGALCSFGVATICIFLIGGRLQHQQKQQQQQKIQLQFYGDDKRVQQVVQQTSRLNQAMSSVMGGGASTRSNI